MIDVPIRPAARPLATLASKKCHQVVDTISMMIVYKVQHANRKILEIELLTYKQFETGEQPHVEA